MWRKGLQSFVRFNVHCALCRNITFEQLRVNVCVDPWLFPSSCCSSTRMHSRQSPHKAHVVNFVIFNVIWRRTELALSVQWCDLWHYVQRSGILITCRSIDCTSTYCRICRIQQRVDSTICISTNIICSMSATTRATTIIRSRCHPLPFATHPSKTQRTRERYK